MDALAALDSLMLAGEKLGSPTHVGIVLIFTPPSDAGPDYLDELHRDSLLGDYDIDPRLRRHPHQGLDTGGLWVWREAAEVDLRKHMRRTTLPAGSGLPQLWELVSTLHSERLEMSAPLWSSCLIDGLADGRFALYVKVHHIVVDGVGGLKMISDSLSPDPERRFMPPFYVGHHRAAAAVEHRRRLPNPLAAVDLARRVAAAEIANIAGSLRSDTVVAPLEAPHTRFNARLGPRRTATGTSLSRARIQAVQKSAGVTGNDAITAVIAGAVRAWLQARGELPQRSLVAMCPVSVRSNHDDDAAEESSGNQFGLGLCPLGTDIADPVARLTFIHRAMTGIKNEVASKGSDAMLAVMGPAIGSTVVPALLPFPTAVPPSCNLAISNVPGPRKPMYYNGAHLDEFYPVSTAFDGMGLNVTVCRYAGQIMVGYVSAAGIIDDIGELVGLTEAALAELEAAFECGQPRQWHHS